MRGAKLSPLLQTNIFSDGEKIRMLSVGTRTHNQNSNMKIDLKDQKSVEMVCS